jgi:hypothetical protein
MESFSSSKPKRCITIAEPKKIYHRNKVTLYSNLADVKYENENMDGVRVLNKIWNSIHMFEGYPTIPRKWKTYPGRTFAALTSPRVGMHKHYIPEIMQNIINLIPR